MKGLFHINTWKSYRIRDRMSSQQVFVFQGGLFPQTFWDLVGSRALSLSTWLTMYSLMMASDGVLGRAQAFYEHFIWSEGGVQRGLPIKDASACAASIIVESWWVEFPESSMSPAELTDYDRRLRGKRPSQEELRSTSTWTSSSVDFFLSAINYN